MQIAEDGVSKTSGHSPANSFLPAATHGTRLRAPREPPSPHGPELVPWAKELNEK